MGCVEHMAECSINREVSLLFLVGPVMEEEHIESELLISDLYVCHLSTDLSLVV